MALYEIQTSDGSTYQIEGADDLTPQELEQAVAQSLAPTAGAGRGFVSNESGTTPETYVSPDAALERLSKGAGVPADVLRTAIDKARTDASAFAEKNKLSNDRANNHFASIADIYIDDAINKWKLDNQGVGATLSGMSLSDIPNMVKSGVVGLARGVNELIGNEYDSQLASDEQKRLQGEYSNALRNDLSMSAGAIKAAGESGTQMLLTAPVGGLVGSGAKAALGATKLGAAAEASAAIAGSVGNKAPILARAINATPGVAGAAAMETTLGGSQGASQAADDFDNLFKSKPELVRSSEAYKAALEETGSDSAAIDMIRREAVLRGASYTALASMLTAPIGGGALEGFMLRRLAGQKLGEKTIGGALRETLKVGAAETGQEFVQSGAESIAGDIAQKPYNPEAEIDTDKALVEASMGGIVGGMMAGPSSAAVNVMDVYGDARQQKRDAIAAEKAKLDLLSQKQKEAKDLESQTEQAISDAAASKISDATSTAEAVEAFEIAARNNTDVAKQVLKSAGVNTAIADVDLNTLRQEIESQLQELDQPAEQAEASRPTTTQGTTGERGGMFKSSATYALDTEDNGTFDVKVGRLPDGSVVIVDGVHIYEFNKDFASGKTDEELLAYQFEPVGFRSASPASTPSNERVWTGRSADGYATQEEAASAIPRAQSRYPDANFVVTPTADGRFVLKDVGANSTAPFASAASPFASIAGETSTIKAPKTVGELRNEARDTQALVDTLNGISQGLGDNVRGRADISLSDPKVGEVVEAIDQLGRITQVAFGFTPRVVGGINGYGLNNGGTVFLNAEAIATLPKKVAPRVVLVHAVGHEGFHSLETSKDEGDRQAATVLKEVVAQYAKPGVIQGRQMAEESAAKAEGSRVAANIGLREVAADVSGSMWLDSKFWGMVYDKDPNAFRRIAYSFMRAATKFLQIAKGSRFDINTMIVEEGIEAVREAAATAWAQRGNKTKSRTQIKQELFSAPSYSRTGETNEVLAGRNGFVPADAGQDGSTSAGDGRGAPSYGKPREGAVSVVGRHYSKGKRTTLSGLFYGQGLKGAESRRLEGASSQIRSRIYFYVDTGKGIRPESGVGGYAHEVRLDNIYDPATKLIPPQASSNAFEEAVVKAGFDGWIDRNFTTTNGAVVLLGTKHGAVPVRYVQDAQNAPSPVSEAPSTIKKSLLSKEANAVNVDAIPGAKMRMGTLEVPVDQRDAANAEMERIGSDVRYSRATEAANLEAALGLAKGKVWRKGRDLKVAIQQSVIDAAARDGIDPSIDTPETRKYLLEVGLRDGLFALKQNPNAIGWYDLKTRQALAVMSLVHPEIAKDENAKLAFVWAMAVTSNGLKVGLNFQIAERVYESFKKTGQMPSNMGIGTAKGAIDDSLVLFNQLRSEWGIDNLRQFMQTDFTVSEITGIAKDLKPGGEHADVVVKGASILGPKIGNGFFSNLYGNFGSLTMDRWLIRTWGRWTGTLIKAMPEQTADARARLSTVLAKIAGNENEAARLSSAINTEITADMSVDDLAVAVQKASMKPDIRTEMNKTADGVELRKAGNGLAKYLDGQKEAPQGPTERKMIRAVFGEILTQLRNEEAYKDLTMADLQAVLWYAEKRLYESAKDDVTDDDVDGYSDEDAPDYANAASEVAASKGISDRKIQNTLRREEDGRTGTARLRDEPTQEAGAGKQAASGGFTRQEKRKFIGERAVLRARANRKGDEGKPGSYAQDSTGGGRGFRVLKKLGVSYTDAWKVSPDVAPIFRANDIATPVFYELVKNEQNAQKFSDAITASKAQKFGAAVYVYDVADYQNMRMFLSDDGKSGVAIKPDGDIVSVFSTGGAGRAIMELAVSAGGRKLDAFNTTLPWFYAPHGFKAVARTKWNDEFAPEGWNKQTFIEHNNGEPDVVFMVYDPSKQDADYSNKDGKVFTGPDAYDKAVAAQTREVKRIAKSTNQPIGNLSYSRAQEDTPEFKAWSEGLPVQESFEGRSSDRGIFKLYHMTTADFSEFKPGGLNPTDSGPAIWLSTDPAATSSAFRVGNAERGFREGANTMPVYAKVKNPLVIDDAGMLDYARSAYADGSREFPQLISPQAVALLKEDGHDSIIFDGKGVGWKGAPVEIIVLDGKQIKSAIGNNGQFDPENPDIRYSRSELGYYSALERGLESLATKTAPAKAWQDAIKGLVNKGTAKADEVEWSGVNDWLALQEGKVTKQQILDYLQSDGVKVQETVLGGEPNDMPEWGALNDERKDAPKYSQYTLPGGENYREVLLTLPEKPIDDGWKIVKGPGGEFYLKKPDGSFHMGLHNEPAYWSSKSAAESALAFNRPKNTYKSSHWDQPNVLAHIRVNDRTDADGNKVLFVEEVQSDWGQDGKKKGFAEAPPQVTAELVGESKFFPGKSEYAIYVNGTRSGTRHAKTASEAIERARSALPLLSAASSVEYALTPRAPFVTKTDGWLNLALKRIITMAVEGGYEKVAFVNGEQSADRYDLSKTIGSVQFLDNGTGGIGDAQLDGEPSTGMLIARDHNQKKVIEQRIEPSQIEDYVGKEIAAKLLAATPRRTRMAGLGYRGREVSGLDLRVGGEGMKTFYDSIVPNAVKKLISKMDGKLETVNLSNASEDFDPWDLDSATDEERAEIEATGRVTGLKQPGFTITPKMQEQVDSGLPLFSRSEETTPVMRDSQISSPEFKRWFGDSKVVDADGKPLVVYHGTGADIASFAPEKSADGVFHFAIDSAMANRFSVSRAKDGVRGANVMPVYLSIKNPKRVSFINTMEINAAKAEGYDGLISDSRGHIVAFDPTQIKSAIGNNGQFDPNNPDIRYSRAEVGSQPIQGNRFSIKGESFLGRQRRKYQDSFIQVKRVQDQVVKQGGRISEATDVYRAEERSHGIIEEALKDFRLNHFDPMIEDVQKAGLTPDELALFAYAKHAPERNERIAEINPDAVDANGDPNGSGMTDKEAADIIQAFTTEGKLADLERLHEKLLDITRANRLEMLGRGLITQAEFDAWEKYEYYVPLRTAEEDTTQPIRRGGRGFSIRGKESMRAMGRSTRAGDILENVFNDYERTVNRAERNDVGLRFLQFVLDNPDSRLWEIDKRMTKQVWDNMAGNVKLSTKIDTSGTVAVKMDGKPVYIKVHDPLLLRAMNAESDAELTGARKMVSVMASFNAMLRASLTQYNPVFAFTNYARDFGMGLVSSVDALGYIGSAKYAKYHTMAWGAANRFVNGKLDLSNQMDKRFEEYRLSGATTGGFYAKDVEQVRQEIRNVLLAAGAKPEGWVENVKTLGGTTTLGIKGVRALGNVLEHMGSVSENVTRFAAFAAARDNGKSVAEAASIAKNLTTNFNRKGEYGAILNSAYLFFNASVQGSAQVLKTMKNPKVLAGVLPVMAAAGFLLAGAGGEDDDGQAYWDKIPDYEKERNLIIMLPDYIDVPGVERIGTRGKYIKIPMAYGFNTFVNLGTNMKDVLRNQANPQAGIKMEEAAKRMISSVMGSFNPVGGAIDLNNQSSVVQAALPTLFDVIYQQASGVDSFSRGTAPKKRDDDTKPDSENVTVKQAGSATHKLARWLNSATGGDKVTKGLIDVAPGSIDNLINSGTGGVGRFIGDVANLIAKKNTDGVDVTVKDVPLVKNFFGEVNDVNNTSLMYERIRQAKEAHEQVRDNFRTGTDSKNIGQEQYVLDGVYKASTAYTKALRQIRIQEFQIADSEMSDTEKRVRLNELRKQREGLAVSFNQMFMSATRVQDSAARK